MEKCYVKYNLNKLENELNDPQCYFHNQIEFFNDFYTEKGATEYIHSTYEDKLNMLKSKKYHNMEIENVEIHASYCNETGCCIRASFKNVDLNKSVEISMSAILIANTEK